MSLSKNSIFRAALPAFPLAMIALPIFMVVPGFYSKGWGLSLSLIGGLLFVTRLMDTVIDPWLGHFSDYLNQKGISKRALIVFSTLASALSMYLLFHPVGANLWALSIWLFLTSLLSYIFFSLGTINLLGWAFANARSPQEQLSVSTARESLGLLGVIYASATLATSQETAQGISNAFLIGLVCSGIFVLLFFPKNENRQVSLNSVGNDTEGTRHSFSFTEMFIPLKNRSFRLLVAGYLLSAIAAAFPSTLFLFFVQDVIRKSDWTGLFLVSYFASGAAGTFVWSAISRRWGVFQAWLSSLVLSVCLFFGASFLGAGHEIVFLAICILSGLCLGADLALPSILVNQILNRDRQIGAEGAFFGLWAFVGKVALAIAAGLSLPVLDLVGYKPGGTEGLVWVSFLYCFGPCVFRLLAALLLAKNKNKILNGGI